MPRPYRVVINHEEQYSVWPIEVEPKGNWRDAGVTASKEGAMAHVWKVWTDMRPLSLRK